MAYLMDTAKFEHTYRIATVMAMASVLPDHLRDNNEQRRTEANCFLVVNQAFRWGFDPFAVAPETYVVGGKLGFQGKLIAAVVNARAGLKRRLDYTFAGSGDERCVTVSGEFEGEDQPRTITLRVRDAKTPNKMWTVDPDQKLVYSGSIKWARRYCPEIVLGVLTDDDLDRIESVAPTPAKPTGRKSLDDVAAELMNRGSTITVDSKESQVEQNGVTDPPWSDALRKCETLGEVQAVMDNYVPPDGTTPSISPEDIDALETACNARRDIIRSGRGGKAKQGELV